MRKTLLAGSVAAAVLMAGSQALAQGNFRIGVDLGGDHEASAMGVSQTDSVGMGISLAVESASATDTGEAGVGIEYQLKRGMEDYTPEPKFGFIPIYAYGRKFFGSGDKKGYVLGRIGYNIFTGDDEYSAGVDLGGGISFAIGGGVTVADNQRLELVYAINNGEISVMGITLDVKYSRLGVGYSMSF